MKESRKFIRLRAPLAVEYSLIKKGKRQKMQRSSMKNISIGGLSLLLKEEVRHGDLMRVEIQIPQWVDPIRVTGDVVWHNVSGERHNRVHEAGVRFQEVNPVELNKILDYVYSVAIG